MPRSDHVGEKTVLARRRFSAYSEPSVATDLDDLNRKAAIIVGIEAHVCVH
ncbi:MAG: isochorismatase family protein [Arenicellales bacterium]|nr:isochorismatase family protein [Arenicellales bacterium]